MLLINAGYNKVAKLGIFAHYVAFSIPVGIGSIAAYLMNKGVRVGVIDEHIEEVGPNVLRRVLKDQPEPHIFGISCLTASAFRGYELARMIKDEYPSSTVILGGIHPTVLPNEALAHDGVDIVIRGEGERTLYLVYDAIKDGRDYSGIKGVSCRDRQNHITHNGQADIIDDLSELPPFPYHIFDNHRDRYNLGFIISSRGCPYRCIFCSQQSISGRRYRAFALERVIDEMDLLINKYGQKRIAFIDDNFLVSKERTKELCELMLKNGFHKKCAFEISVRGDSIDAEILPYLKMAGIRAIFIGFETASERIMKLIKKDETVQANINAARLAKKIGLYVYATFIMGFPTETKEERWQAYRLAKKLRLDCVRFNNATPYPGTELFEIAKRENRLNIAEGWSNLNACGSLVDGGFREVGLPYVPIDTTEDELNRDLLKANLLYSLRPKVVLDFLKGDAPWGWLQFPKRWYFKPREWLYLGELIIYVLISLSNSLFRLRRHQG